MLQSPIWPTIPSVMPTRVRRLRTGSPKMAVRSPSRISDAGAARNSLEGSASVRALGSRQVAARSHRSGSFTRRRISTTSKLGITPKRNKTRQPAVWPKVACGPTRRLSPDPMIAPTDEKAWTNPSANGRARAGMVSATRATPAAYSPPMPMPHRKRKTANSGHDRARPESAVKIE